MNKNCLSNNFLNLTRDYSGTERVIYIELHSAKKDFLIKKFELNLERQKSIYLESDSLVVLSPTVKNKRFSFDLSKDVIIKAKESNKEGYLVIIFFDFFLVTELWDFTDSLLKEETIHTYDTGRQKWSLLVKKRDDDYFVAVYSHEKEYRVLKMNAKELEDYINREDINENDEKAHYSEPRVLSVRAIHSFITSKGFNYSLHNIKNLYLSLRSKPFVIISGISGTGKTKIVQLFAESVGATEENGQFKLIPVRPDWSDGSELLGYTDIKGEFQKGPLTEMVEHAIKCPTLPHFVLLDEMNLARVEYYFSDVLSVMESRRRDGDEIISSYLLDAKATGVPLRLPENLFIVGTVNMDETTHPFSKKVLDRANTIEFNEVYLENFEYLEEQEEVEAQTQTILNEQLVANYISLKDVYDGHSSLISMVSSRLAEINRILEPLNAHVGYRVRDEICFYMVHNANAGLLDESEAFDFCVMQKILPRITGGDGRVDTLLNELLEWLTGVSYDVGVAAKSADYPRSTKKVTEMLRRYHADGFTSFWIS